MGFFQLLFNGKTMENLQKSVTSLSSFWCSQAATIRRIRRILQPCLLRKGEQLMKNLMGTLTAACINPEIMLRPGTSQIIQVIGPV
jgi:hypothetical protein